MTVRPHTASGKKPGRGSRLKCKYRKNFVSSINPEKNQWSYIVGGDGITIATIIGGLSSLMEAS